MSILEIEESTIKSRFYIVILTIPFPLESPLLFKISIYIYMSIYLFFVVIIIKIQNFYIKGRNFFSALEINFQIYF